jgi:hypothetical protein
MARKKAGGTHTTLTDAAKKVVKELDKLPDGVIKFYSPGRITDPKRSGGTIRLNLVHTTAGIEMKICGNGVQIVTVHTDHPREMIELLKRAKALKNINIKETERMPG